jgi:quercetin dioxygenase-like cupin family protein
MRLKAFNTALFALAAIGTFFAAVPAFSSTNETLAVGTIPYSDLFGGPATMTTRRLTIAPGEVLGWHYHPGVGAYTIVKQGTLTVEDGCGGEEVFTAGQAFIEDTNRVHRGKNLGTEPVITLQTFLVPQGSPISVTTPKMCGQPAKIEECQYGNWMNFTFPRSFSNQGECTLFVINGNGGEGGHAHPAGPCSDSTELSKY